LNIDYVISFSIKGDSGKNKATREKSKLLSLKANSFKIYKLDDLEILPMHNKVFKLAVLFIFEFYYLFKTIFNNRKPDLIFTRSFFGFGTYLISIIYNSKLIREKHGDFYEEALILFKKNIVTKFIFRLIQKYKLFFLKRANGVIFNNPELENSYNDKYNLNKHVKTTSVYNGANTEEFEIIDADKAKNMLNLSNNTDYFLFIGSMSKWHGVDLLLDTYNQYKKNYIDNTKLLMVGGKDNTYYHYLKDKYESKNIIFTGKVPLEKAKLYINASLIGFLPVNNNRTSPGSPLKLYDYIACGKPIITQVDTIGYSNIILKYNLGITCDFRNSKSASKKIKEFYENLDKEFYRRNNRLVAEENLNWSNVINEWLCFAKKL